LNKKITPVLHGKVLDYSTAKRGLCSVLLYAVYTSLHARANPEWLQKKLKFISTTFKDRYIFL